MAMLRVPCLLALLPELLQAETSTEVGGVCEFENAPVGVGHFWDPTCVDGGLGCDADGKHAECRLCGSGDFVSVPCPPSVCNFADLPYIPYFWDAECEMGMVGCNADGTHVQCRFCGDFPFTNIHCPEGAAPPPSASCNFTEEPAIPAYWEPGCVLGMHGCNADGQHVQCRYCGKGEFSHVHCPGSQVCDFVNVPTVPYYYDSNCMDGELGCKADGVHVECRFCGVGDFESVPCPAPHEGVHICRSFLGDRQIPYFWDEACELGKLGCFADGIHSQCRFCGAGNYSEVPCPDDHSGNLRGR